MKPSLFCSLCLCLALSANAQNRTDSDGLEEYTGIVAGILRSQVSAKHKTTGSPERIKAESHYKYYSFPYGLSDTLDYYYSGSNGSTYDYNEMLYVYKSPVYYFSGQSRDYPHVDILADSVHEFASSYHYTFGPDNKLTDYSYYSPFNNPYWKYKLIYNPQGQLTETRSYSGTVVNSRLKTHYSGLGMPTRDSLIEKYQGSNQLVELRKYEYDTAGNLIKYYRKWWHPLDSTWEFVTHLELTYDGAGRLSTSIFRDYEKDSFGYTPGAEFYTYREKWFGQENHWGIFTREVKHLNQDGFPDTVFTAFSDYQNPPHYSPGGNSVVFIYNSAGDPIHSMKYFIDTVGNAHLNEEHFYYYEPKPALGVSMEQKPGFYIYPNPASDKLMISGIDASSKRFDLMIADMSGRVLIHRSVPAEPTIEVDLGGIASGVYFLAILSVEGGAICKQAILKK